MARKIDFTGIKVVKSDRLAAHLANLKPGEAIATDEPVDYNELTNRPPIGNGMLTIKQGGVTKGTFTANQAGNTEVNLDAGGGSGGGIPEPPYDEYTYGRGYDSYNNRFDWRIISGIKIAVIPISTSQITYTETMEIIGDLTAGILDGAPHDFSSNDNDWLVGKTILGMTLPYRYYFLHQKTGFDFDISSTELRAYCDVGYTTDWQNAQYAWVYYTEQPLPI